MKTYIMFSIGLMLLTIGVSGADSVNLIIPTILAFTGAIIMLIESKKFEDDDL